MKEEGTWGIVGHERVVKMLSRAIANGRVNHAYLFTGAPGIGKTTLARAFAKALICPSTEPPCDHCRTCQAIDKGTHPDFRLLQMAAAEAGAADEDDGRASKKRSIGISQIRELQRESALLPYDGKWKVYVVRNAEDLTTEAANCLLKTLEEPPSLVVLILTCSDAKILPTTVVSRCQQINLWPLGVADVKAALQRRLGVGDEAKAGLLAHLSDGRIGWALNALEDDGIFAERESKLARVAATASASRTERFKYAEEMASAFGRDPEAVLAALELWSNWWRDLLVVRNGCRELVINVNMVSRLVEQAMKYTVEQIHGFLGAIEATRSQLEQNVNAKLALEVMMLKVPQARD